MPGSVLTEHCVWSVNTGFDAKRTEWTVDNDFEVGYIKKDKKPPVKDVFELKLAEEAVPRSRAGRSRIGKCTE